MSRPASSSGVYGSGCAAGLTQQGAGSLECEAGLVKLRNTPCKVCLRPHSDIERTGRSRQVACFSAKGQGVLRRMRRFVVVAKSIVGNSSSDEDTTLLGLVAQVPKMIGCNCVVNFEQLQNYLEDTYGLNVEVVVTYEPIIWGLDKAGFDTSSITVVDDIPHDIPVIWMYNIHWHWVVRYEGWNYDPIHGKYPFSETKDIYRPDQGIGLIVTKPEDSG